MKKSLYFIYIILTTLLLFGVLFGCTSDTRKIYFDQDTYHLYLQGGNTSLTPSVGLRPRNNNYTLTVSNPTIVKVEDKTITALKEGIVTLTATSGELTDTATVMVHAVYTGEHDNNAQNDGKFVVYFETEYSVVPAQRVADGEKALLPTAPNREGYKLYGWYLDKEFTTPYDFNTPVTKSITLYALWGVSTPIYRFTTVEDKVYVSGFKYTYIPYESITLPSTDENGNEVYGVYAGAFKDNTTLKEINVPDTFKVIEGSAFENCTKLERVTFVGSGLETIKEFAFQGCTSLTEIDFGGEGLLTIATQAFQGDEKLATITLPSSLTQLNAGAFMNCKALTACVLPSSLKVIEMQVFAGTGLTSIDLSGIEAIYNQAFWGATALSTITGGESLKTIGSYAFGSLLSSEQKYATEWLKNTSTVTVWGDKVGAKATYLGDALVYVSPVGIGTKPLPIYVRANTTTIAGQALSDVSNAMVYFLSADNPPTYGTNAFGGTTAPTVDVVVPTGRTETYSKAWLITSTDEDGYYVPSAYSLSLVGRIYEFTNIYHPSLDGMTLYSRYPLVNFSNVEGEKIYYSKLNAKAANDPYAGIAFSETEKNYVIHSYIGTATEIDLLTLFTQDAGTKIVTIDRICPYAFGANNTLVTLTLPNRILKIDNLAFIECAKLESLYLRGDVSFTPLSEHVDEYSFGGSFLPKDMKIYVPQSQLDKYNVRWGTKCGSVKGRFVGE